MWNVINSKKAIQADLITTSSMGFTFQEQTSPRQTKLLNIWRLHKHITEKRLDIRVAYSATLLRLSALLSCYLPTAFHNGGGKLDYSRL